MFNNIKINKGLTQVSPFCLWQIKGKIPAAVTPVKQCCVAIRSPAVQELG